MIAVLLIATYENMTKNGICKKIVLKFNCSDIYFQSWTPTDLAPAASHRSILSIDKQCTAAVKRSIVFPNDG